MAETLWDSITEFLSPEAGQRRRAALDEFGRDIGYYVPPEMRGLLGFAAEMTPTATLERAGQASQRMFDADRTATQRVGDLGAMLSETAGVAAPMMVAPRAGMTAAQAVQEGLLGASVAADDVGRRFVDRMNQPGPVPTMYSNPLGQGAADAGQSLPAPRNDAEVMARDILEMRAAGRAGDVTDEMMAQADPQYMFANTPLPMDEASRMARAGEIDAYHGTDRTFSAFDSRRFGEKDPGWYGRGVTTDTDPEVAAGYADYNEAEIGQQIIPVRLSGGRYMEWPEGQLPFGNPRDSMVGTKNMQSLGYAGSRMTNDRDLYGDLPDIQTEYVTFDPANVRSRFARFDPEFRHLRNLSAGVAGGGLLAAQDEQQQREDEIRQYLGGLL